MSRQLKALGRRHPGRRRLGRPAVLLTLRLLAMEMQTTRIGCMLPMLPAAQALGAGDVAPTSRNR